MTLRLDLRPAVRPILLVSHPSINLSGTQRPEEKAEMVYSSTAPGRNE